MKKTVFTGGGVAVVTPMNEDFSVNFEKLDELVEFHVENGTDAIVACGTTGESSTLSHEEHLAVIGRVIKKAAGRVPVIAGTGSNDTAYAIELSREAENLGADALLLVTPYYNKTSQQGLIKHYTMIADSVTIPNILYSVASRTGMQILPATCKALAGHPNIVAIKEASENIDQVAQIAALCGDDLAIYSGCDALNLPILALGAKGVISVLANILPRETRDMCALWFEGKVAESRAIQLKYIGLIKDLFADVNPVPIKAAMNKMGMAVGPCKMPLDEITPEADARLTATLKKHGLI
ncbi:MAG: 4-hydroxy-tetrahydrodipicolinate synthase [Oscillospiraceae bacterium]|nr:4-hydroxy-tetrahydrodipicolinate synthase [Oscillospiraceae bacterium]